MSTQIITAQNGVSSTLTVPRSGKSYAATITTDSNNGVNDSFALQVEMITGQWLSFMVYDSTTGNIVSSLVGPSKSGWTNVPNANAIRAIRLDANGGNSKVAINVHEA